MLWLDLVSVVLLGLSTLSDVADILLEPDVQDDDIADAEDSDNSVSVMEETDDTEEVEHITVVASDAAAARTSADLSPTRNMGEEVRRG